MIDDAPDETRLSRLTELKRQYDFDERFILNITAAGKLAAGDISGLQDLLQISPLLADEMLTAILLKALKHDPNMDYHLVLKKNPAVQGKGKTIADESRKKVQADILMARMVLNGVHLPRQKSSAVDITASETGVSQTKLNQILKTFENNNLWNWRIQEYRNGDQEITQHLEHLKNRTDWLP